MDDDTSEVVSPTIAQSSASEKTIESGTRESTNAENICYPVSPAPLNEGPHKTLITMTLAVAYPKPLDEHSRILEELVKKNKKTIESPKPIHFLHCEYVVSPLNAATSTDVVTYAVAAKVFTDQDSRVVKTWDDGERIWVAWMHSHEVEVSMDNIALLHGHEIDVKLWDAREKVSSKARGDRPKAFRLPSDTDIKFPGQGVRGVVSRLSNNWKSSQPRNSVVDGAAQAKLAMTPEAETRETAGAQDTGGSAEKEKLDKRRTSALGKLAGINPSEEEKKRLSELKLKQAALQKKLTKSGKQSTVLAADRKNKEQSAKKRKHDRNTSPRKTSGGEKPKPVSIKLKLEQLFAGANTFTARLVDRSSSIIDGFVTMTADEPLMTPEMERILNPMCIKIKSVKDLPNTPIPQSKLEKTSKPVYCKYKFLDHSFHTTNGRQHGKHVFFEDTHVIFLGALHEGVVREYILSNAFQIEVHDRDHVEEEETEEANIFGIERSDQHISSVALISAKRTAYNAFQTTKKGYDPYGVAKVSLTDLLRGKTTLNTEVVVTPCPIPEAIKEPGSQDEQDPRLVGVPGAVDRPERPPQLPGDYLEHGTTLKLKITLCCSLVPVANAPRLVPLPQQICPFSRTVIYFSYSNKTLLRKIENFVTMANARALGLENLDKNVIDAALSTFKLSKDQKHSQILDIVTGFHIIDGNYHLMVLEGLHEEAMQRFLDEVNMEKETDDEVLVHLYDTSQTFATRLYSALDVDLCRVRLHQPLADVMSQPLIYVRDVIPKDCLECVTKLNQMLQINKLRDVVYSNLFPTAEMVISLSREFGIPLTYEDFEKEPRPATPYCVADEMHPQLKQTDGEQMQNASSPRKRLPDLDTTNDLFEKALRERKAHPVNINHVAANIVAVQEAGKRRRPSRPKVQNLQVDLPVHNYSSQTLNSTELAKSVLRDMLRRTDPSGRYSYNPNYFSSMFDPVDVDEFYRKKDAEAKESWRTKEGFIYPGMNSSMQDNYHSLKPAESRIADLKLSFRDNVLHRNVMEPILERDNFKWENRKKDLNLYSKPDTEFGDPAPLTVMLAGIRKQEEENRFKAQERQDWMDRVVVDDTLMRFHRLLWETEDSNYACQIDKLDSVLKDQPIKYSLAKHPAPVLPPLSVVFNPSVDTAAREAGVKLPPAFDESAEKSVGFLPGPYDSRRWVMEGNRIPIKDEQHKKFAKKHGKDINLIHKERSLLSTRIPLKPLTEEEYQTHLFRIPSPEKKESQDLKKTEGEVYGRGPRGRSEYRMKYPTHEAGERIREVYPRHTFHGFAPVKQDGKPLAHDASVELVPTGSNWIEQETSREERGKLLQDEASVELTHPTRKALASVEVS